MDGPGSSECSHFWLFCTEAIQDGYSVLIHCRAGKHRSGAFASLLLALILGKDMEGAMDMYFGERGLAQAGRARCRSACVYLGLQGFVDKLLTDEFCLHERRAIYRKTYAAVPEALPHLARC